MTILSIIKITALLSCCVLATISDIREGTISNKLVAIYGIMGIVTDIVSWLLSSPEEYRLFILNAGSLIIIAFILYFLHIWAGGDCKLLVVVALLYPSEFYWRFDSTPFTLWYSIGFMFGIGFVYVILESLVYWNRDKGQKWSQDSLKAFLFTLLQYIKAMVYMSALYHIYLYFIYPHVKIPNTVISMLLMLCIWKIRSMNFYKSIPLTVVVAVFDLAMTLLTGTITISTNWITYLIVLAFMVMRLFVSKYNYQTIEAVNIKKGMILSRVSSVLMQSSRIKGLPGISDESLDSRLTEEEAANIIRWSQTTKGLKHVIIVRKIPFAVFISIGTVLYFATRGVLK